MKVLLILLVIIFSNLSVYSGVCEGYKYQILQFSQKVDHFGYSNGDYFKQRYLVNFESYSFDGNGSVFVYAGNEGDIEMFANNTGFMWEYAPKFNAALLFIEHRYYGKSMPYGDLSYKNKSYLGYLTSEQALADYAAIITFFKSKIPYGSEVPYIVFGGSYGGMLAAWFRIKYPHIINGAIASSAPILQFGTLTPCDKFAQIVTHDFAVEGSECAKSIRRSWDIIHSLYDSAEGKKFLTETFHLCKQFQPWNVSDLINWLSDTWSYMAMTNYPYPTNFLVPLPANPIKKACSYLQKSIIPDHDLIINIYKAASVFHNYTGETKCTNLTESGGKSLGEEGWDFQQCTEMVQPVCQTGINDMFEPVQWNLSTYTKDCFEKYGVVPELNKTILMYGGKDITASSNIVFTNGLLDPWYGGGVLKSLSSTIIAILIENAAHHLDLRSSNPDDPVSVVQARQEILKWISIWIQEAKRN